MHVTFLILGFFLLPSSLGFKSQWIVKMSVSDTFTDPQSPNSFITGFGYTPAGTREVSGVPFVSTDLILNFTSTETNGYLSYIYGSPSLEAAPQAFNPQDFTLLDTITMNVNSVTNGGAFDMQATLTDINFNTGTAIPPYNVTGPGTFAWPVNQFTGVDLTQIIGLQFDFQATGAVTDFQSNLGPIVSAFVCLARGTNILMADGSRKEIQDIKRGDLVAGNKDRTIIHKVAALNDSIIDGDRYIDIVTMEKDALQQNVPDEKLILSGNHPIFYKNARRPAKCFCLCKGITFYSKANEEMPVKELLTKSEEDTFYHMYDLQFDHDGSYIANGVEVQSRSPYSEITPLPKELYFEPEKYWKEKSRVWDSLDQSLPLDDTIVQPY